MSCWTSRYSPTNLDRVGGRVVDTHPQTRRRVYVLIVLSLGRLLPDTKFVPTAHERLSA